MIASEVGELFQKSCLCQCWDNSVWLQLLLLQDSAKPWSPRLCFPPPGQHQL